MKVLALSESHILAIHGMAIIAANDGKKVTVAQIAGATNASANHLFKVFEVLTKAKLLSAFKGPTGGFLLKKPSAEIFLMEIYEAFSGKINEDDLCFDKNTVLVGLGPMQELCKKLSLKFIDFLKTTSIDDIKDRANIV